MKMLLPLSTYLLASTVNAMTFHEKVVSKKIRQEAKNPLLTPRNLFVGKSETSMLCKDRPLGNQCCPGEDWNCQPPNSVCSCDQGCIRQNDCCSDYEDTCSHMLGTPKKTCKGTGTARANGDPHYMTFDEKVIHFQGNCTYLLSKNCKEGPVDFKIFGRNENRYGNMDMSWTKDIILMYKNIKIELLKGGKVMLNNERAYTPTLLPDGTKIDKSGNYVSISTFFGIQIFYDGEGNSEIKASCDWFDKLCGLLGNYNGDFNDDFKGSDDVTYNEMSVEAFGKSWKRPGLDNRDGCGADLSELEPRTRPWIKWVEELEQRPNGTMPHCTEQQFNAAIDRCSILIDDMANFQQCFDNVSPQKFYENCIWDQCATKLADGAFCDSLGTDF